MLMLVLALLVVGGLRLVLVLARLRFLGARRLRFRLRLRLADVVYDELVCGSPSSQNDTHFVFARNLGLASTSMAAVEQILLVLQHQNGFGKTAARAENVDLDKLVQDLQQVGVRMISIYRGLFFFLVVLRLRSQLIPEELGNHSAPLSTTFGR